MTAYIYEPAVRSSTYIFALANLKLLGLNVPLKYRLYKIYKCQFN